MYPASGTLWVVDTQEVSLPPEVEPLHGCLLTTHSVETLGRVIN